MLNFGGMMDRERRKSINRMTIHLAAVKLFSQRKSEDITMDDIASEAHMSKRTIYKYFPSKMSLVSSVFETYMQEEYVVMTNAVKGCKTGRELVLSSSRALYDFTKENLPFMRLLWTLNDEVWGAEIPHEILDKIRTWNEAILDIGSETMVSNDFHGVFASFPPRKINYFISAVNKGIFLQVQKILNQELPASTTDELFEIAVAMYEKCLE
jgi:AcrR family transcriptional regulator